MSIYRGNNVFERIGSLIPGYQGYSDRKCRRESDKILRDKLARIIRRATDNLNVTMRSIANSGDLGAMAPYEVVRKKAELVANKLQFANYGATGFFDVIQFETDTIDKIYSLDFQLSDEATDISTLLEGLPADHNDDSVICEVNIKLDLIAKQLDRRNDLIMGGY